MHELNSHLCLLDRLSLASGGFEEALATYQILEMIVQWLARLAPKCTLPS